MSKSTLPSLLSSSFPFLFYFTLSCSSFISVSAHTQTSSFPCQSSARRKSSFFLFSSSSPSSRSITISLPKRLSSHVFLPLFTFFILFSSSIHLSIHTEQDEARTHYSWIFMLLIIRNMPPLPPPLYHHDDVDDDDALTLESSHFSLIQ